MQVQVVNMLLHHVEDPRTKALTQRGSLTAIFEATARSHTSQYNNVGATKGQLSLQDFSSTLTIVQPGNAGTTAPSAA